VGGPVGAGCGVASGAATGTALEVVVVPLLPGPLDADAPDPTTAGGDDVRLTGLAAGVYRPSVSRAVSWPMLRGADARDAVRGTTDTGALASLIEFRVGTFVVLYWLVATYRSYKSTLDCWAACRCAIWYRMGCGFWPFIAVVMKSVMDGAAGTG
jgi:hypothetical protein